VPFEVPGSWEWTTLGEICSIKGGKRIPKGKAFSKEKTDHVYLRVTDMKNNTIIMSDLRYIDDDVFSEIESYTINSSDLYLTIAGTIGAVGIVPETVNGMNLTENAAKLTNISCDKMYLMYSLLSTIAQEHFSSRFHQVAQPKLSIETASKTPIPLPPIEEQERVVVEIEKWLALIETIESGKTDLQATIKQTKCKILDLAIHGKLVPQDPNDEPASELLKRINPNAEITCDNGQYGQLPKGWVAASISDFRIDILNGYAFQSSKYTNEGVRIIRITNVQDGYIEDDSPKYYPLSLILEYERFMLKSNDLLMSLTGNVGRVGFLPESMLPAALNQRVACIQSNIISTKFLSYLFRTNTFKNECVASAKGVAQLNISTEWLKEYIIMVPPLAEQYRIVAKIEELFTSLDNIQKSLEV
jgi:type I restriction enzyme S subunit